MSDLLVLSGKKVSTVVYQGLSNRIQTLKEKNIIPGLAVILVGENPASKVYVLSKTRTFKKLDLFTKTYRLSSDISQDELLHLITELNNNPSYHGILVQLPLPKHIESDKVINVIDPKKDVDGFHPKNAGLLAIGRPRFIPCTPKGIMKILEHYEIELNGKHVVVVGRSNIVGRPISILTSMKMDGANATTTLCHSRTPDIENHTRSADVVIVALGVTGFLDHSMIKEGAIVIDVGINRIDADNDKGYELVGDVDWSSIEKKASAATPVPGGVGPMTIAMLVENTVEAAENYS